MLFRFSIVKRYPFLSREAKGHRYFMGEFEAENFEKMKEGVRLFNAQKYWECHEVLEDHWLEEPGPVRNVYWAVIQVAASMIHYREANLTGAKGMIYKARQKFDRCESLHVESALLDKQLSWQKLKKIVRAIPSEPVLSDFEQLFQFRFEDV